MSHTTQPSPDSTAQSRPRRFAASRMPGWVLFLQMFEFDTRYRPGVQNALWMSPPGIPSLQTRTRLGGSRLQVMQPLKTTPLPPLTSERPSAPRWLRCWQQPPAGLHSRHSIVESAAAPSAIPAMLTMQATMKQTDLMSEGPTPWTYQLCCGAQSG